MVHITNGDAVAGMLREWAGEPRLIVWHDILHEGPLPAGKTLEEFTAVRVEWLAANGFGDGTKLRERDMQLRRLVARDSLWLWFEDDLYDQLQLVQLLHFLQQEGLMASPHFLVNIPRHLKVEEMAALAANKQRISPEMLATGARAWEAVTANQVPALLDTNLDALAGLRPAMERFLQHGPVNNRVVQTIQALLAEGGNPTPEELFAAYQKTEERPFLGDTTFFRYLRGELPDPQ
jgi:hypothetical protein